VLSCIR
jgi:hypothetical protein